MQVLPETLLIENDPQLTNAVAVTQKATLSLIVLISGTVFIAWLSSTIAQWLPGNWFMMHANTALCFLLSSLFLILHNWQQAERLKKALPFIIAVLALTDLLYHSGISHTYIDIWPAQELPRLMPEVMSIQTASYFLLISGAMAATELLKKNHIVIEFFAFAATALTIFIAAAYFFGATSFYSQSPLIKTSVQTLFCMVLFIISFVSGIRHLTLHSLLVQRDISGYISRTSFPLLMLMPVAMLMADIRFRDLDFHSGPQTWALSTTFILCSAMIAVYFLAIRVKNLELQIQRDAITDELTGAFNRRGFYFLARRMLDLLERTNQTGMLIYFDMDNLKKVNDELGHDAGSDMIQAFSGVLHKCFRKTDIIGRVGGDEFIVLCIENNPGSALQRLSNATDAENKNRLFNAQIEYSLGFQHSTVDQRSSLEEMIIRADSAMYCSKQAKRHQVLAKYQDDSPSAM